MKAIQKKIGGASLILAALLVSSTFCGPKSGVHKAPEISLEKFISVYDEAAENGESVQILDVRTVPEYTDGHVPGAILLPLDQVTAGADIPFAKDSTIYVICRSGNRSMAATNYLRDNGYAGAVSVASGTSGWMAMGKMVKSGDQPR